MVESPPTPAVSAVAVSKAFGATKALEGVDLAVRHGEIHALLGENGAGKSTLAGILSGAVAPDTGTVELRGEAVRLDSTRHALQRGVAIVHQELALMPSLTVEENLSLGLMAARVGHLAAHRRGRRVTKLEKRNREPPSGRIRDRVRELVHEFGLERDASRRVGELSQATRQIVEIVRALSLRASVLILDEPTAALPPRERRELYDRLVVLCDRGIAILLITHMLEEALSVSNQITVLRDGRRVDTVASGQATIDDLIAMMTGRVSDAGRRTRPGQRTPGQRQVVLDIDRLASAPVVRNVTFTLHAGEIVGLAGLLGSGRTETLEAIFGVRPRNPGSVRLDGRRLRLGSAASSIKSGIAFLPEDRQADGLFGPLTVAENVALGAIATRRGRWRSVIGRAGRLKRQGIDALTWQLADEVDIAVDDVKLPITSLSGGNQQKALLARLLATGPRVLLADEPTRGVSVGSRIQIYDMLRRLATDGMSICVASSDFEELTLLCDRIVVLARGGSAGVFAVEDMTADELLDTILRANRTDPITTR